jgi:hypothetical protein
MAKIHITLADKTTRDIELGEGVTDREIEAFLNAEGHFSTPRGWVRIGDRSYINRDAIVQVELRDS